MNAQIHESVNGNTGGDIFLILTFFRISVLEVARKQQYASYYCSVSHTELINALLFP